MIDHHVLAVASKNSYDVHTHVVGSAEATITTCDDKNYVCAFTGTQKDGRDILTDLRAFPWWDRELRAWCHSGFLKTTRPLFDYMFGALASIVRGGNTIHFTGHSLGAARATVAAAKFRKNWSTAIITLTGFGSPPVQYGHGLEKWLVDVPTTMYKHGADFVPSHPMLGSHVCEITEVGNEDTLSRSLSDKRWLDHRISNYCTVI
jgi:predicted lipase